MFSILNEKLMNTTAFEVKQCEKGKLQECCIQRYREDYQHQPRESD